MSTRTSTAGFLLLLAACTQEADEQPAAAAMEEDSLIECALDGSGSFARDCTIERTARAGALAIVVRHPDGSFRRFAAYENGTEIETADGAERAATTPYDGGLEVAVGSNRYRIETPVKADDAS